MRKLLILLIFPLLMGSTEIQNNFCKGYDKGYKAGYCHQVQFCIEPISPICPLPEIGEDSNSFKDGYNRGFVDGYNDKD